MTDDGEVTWATADTRTRVLMVAFVLVPLALLVHLKAFVKRHPRLRSLVGQVLDRLDRVLYRIALLPFRRPQKPGSAGEDPELLKRTDEYNAAAERYFATYADASQLLDKPFSDVEGFSEHLIRVGTLLSAARIRPGDTIVEIGAGTCWASHLLNRYGCHTVAVDVSRTALDIGKKLFEREPSTNWSLDPRFVVYDGRTLPLDDGMCDCVVVYDAFHHIPNQRRLLSEMHRVLQPHGMVVMSEPGVGHADTPASVAERETGVLENELVVADIGALAAAVGFRDSSLLVSTPFFRYELPTGELGAFTGGAGFSEYWDRFSNHLMVHHCILLHMGTAGPTTARLGDAALLAGISIVGPSNGRGLQPAGQSGHAIVSVENRGSAVWLHAEGRGWTRLGGQLCAVNDELSTTTGCGSAWHGTSNPGTARWWTSSCRPSTARARTRSSSTSSSKA